MTLREKLAAVYDKIPAIKCAGKCQECCGPIVVTNAERKQMLRHGKPKNPARKADTLTCPSLDVAFGTCSVYVDRPIICRLWGVVAGMPCPYGCVPERVLSDDEAYALISEVKAISAVQITERIGAAP